MTIPPEFYIRLKNKDFVLFGGLLDAATKAGLRSVTTEIRQMPDASNGNYAVVTSRIEFEDGRVFAEVGDASPASVGSMIVPHLLRMASTRAIGRAFRLGLNISATMKEELGGDDDETAQNHAHRPAAYGKQAPVSPPGPAAGPPAAAAPAKVQPAREATPLACSYPQCGAVITAGQHGCSIEEHGLPFCPTHAGVQDDFAIGKSGKEIGCKIDGCNKVLTNNEVMRSNHECKMLLCREHRTAMLEGRELSETAVPA